MASPFEENAKVSILDVILYSTELNLASPLIEKETVPNINNINPIKNFIFVFKVTIFFMNIEKLTGKRNPIIKNLGCTSNITKLTK